MTLKSFKIFFGFTVLFSLNSYAQQQAYGTYGLYSQSTTRSMAMGGAFVALSDDASGININPAGLAKMSTWGDLAGSYKTVLNAEADLNGDGVYDGVPYLYLYGSGALKFGRWGFGVGISSPYVTSLSFPLSISGFTDNVTLTMAITSLDIPISYELNKEWSIGMTLHGESLTESYELVSTTNPGKQRNKINVQSKSQATVTLGASYWPTNSNWGYGIAFVPGRTYNIDTSYNSQISPINWFKDAIFPNKTTAGFFYKASKSLKFLGDLDWFTSVQDAVYVGSNIVTGIRNIKILTKDQFVPHLGLEWAIVDEKNWDLYFRTGAYIEPPRLEGSVQRNHFTIGASIRYWVLVLSTALDTASNFSNNSSGLGLSLIYYF